MDRDEIRKQIILSGLLALDEFGYIAYKEPDESMGTLGTLALWKSALKNLSDQQIQAGFEWILESWTNEYNRKPTPGDIKNFVTKNTMVNYGEMWAEIMSCGHQVRLGYLNRKTGEPDPYRWSSPLIPKAIKQMGGLDTFLRLEKDQESTVRAQFRDIVNSLTEKEANRAIVQPLIELQLAQSQAVQKGVIQIAQARERKQAQEPVQDAAPIIEGIKAKFAKAQIEKQQLSREQRKAQLDAYIAEHGIKVQSLIDREFWDAGDQELSELDRKIESMSQAMKGFKVV